MKKMLFVLMTAVWVGMLSSSASATTLFCGSFNTSTTADFARGNPIPIQSGTDQFLSAIGAGKFAVGKALVNQANVSNGTLKYEYSGNFNPNSGTLLMWVKRTGMAVSDRTTFFAAADTSGYGGGRCLRLWTGGQYVDEGGIDRVYNLKASFDDGSGHSGVVSTTDYTITMPLGEWTLLGVTWQYNATTGALDVNYYARNPSNSSFTQGSIAGWNQGTAGSTYMYIGTDAEGVLAGPNVIDQVLVYDTVKTQADFANFFTATSELLPDNFAAKTPVFDLKGQYFYVPQQVAITCDTPNAEIRYTTDGSDPATGTVYTAPFTVSSSVTLKAQAFKAGLEPSLIQSAKVIFSSAKTLFYGNYNTSTTADFARGNPIPIQSGTDQFLSGIGAGKFADGRALVNQANVNATAGTLKYEYAGNFNPNSGSLLMWVKRTGTAVSGRTTFFGASDGSAWSSGVKAMRLWTGGQYQDTNGVNRVYNIKASFDDGSGHSGVVATTDYTITMPLEEWTLLGVTWQYNSATGALDVNYYARNPSNTSFTQGSIAGWDQVSANCTYMYIGTDVGGDLSGPNVIDQVLIYDTIMTQAEFDNFFTVTTEMLRDSFVTKTPVFDLNGEYFSVPQQVAITCDTPNAEIRYTTDGSDPATGTVYTVPFTVSTTATLKAQAFKDGLEPSIIQSARVDISAYNKPGVWNIGTPIVTYFCGLVINNANAQQIAEGGWNLVWVWSLSELNVAQAHGLRAMWAGSLDDATVKFIRNHPALYAYFIKDEPSASEFPDLGATVARLRALDPNHLAYINLYPCICFSTSDYFTYLSQYLSIVKPSLLSYDLYQFTTSGDRSGYFKGLAIISHTAKQAGIPFLNIVQACSNMYDPALRVPNGDELRYLYYTSLAYGAQGISDFVYYYPGFTGGMALADGTPTALYYTAKTVNHEFVAIAQQVQWMNHIGAYHLGDLPPGSGTTDGSSPMRLPGTSPFQLSPGIANTNYVTNQPVRGAVLGLYGPDGQLTHATHTLVVNLNYSNGLNTRVVGPGNLSVFDPATGTWIAQGHSWADVSLPPGGGVLVGLTSAITPAFSVTPSSQSVGAPAGTTTFNVSNAGTGTMTWTAQVIDGGSWLSISSGNSGTNSGTINVAFTANSSWTATRTGTIRITASGVAGSPIDVTVVQAKDRLPGDANGDGMVDVGDLGILAANYGGSGKSWAQGDFNGDGLVDVGDLGILAAHYGSGSDASLDFSSDYAKAFGTTTQGHDPSTTDEETDSSVCSGLGLPLMAGLALMGLMLVKLEEQEVC
jgi:hypothetical protein